MSKTCLTPPQTDAGAYSGENDHLFRAMPITCSGMAIA
jgi:hypothetical protein